MTQVYVLKKSIFKGKSKARLSSELFKTYTLSNREKERQIQVTAKEYVRNKESTRDRKDNKAISLVHIVSWK